MPDQTTAQKISELLLGNRLVACTNFIPASSMFIWEEKINSEKEVVILAKTLFGKIDPIEEFILENHPYEIPLIGSWQMMVNESYYKWMLTQLG